MLLTQKAQRGRFKRRIRQKGKTSEVKKGKRKYGKMEQERRGDGESKEEEKKILNEDETNWNRVLEKEMMENKDWRNDKK